MQFVHDDGGRAAAGFKGSAGDCVTRAIAIATMLPYAEAYAALNSQRDSMRQTKRVRGSSARTGLSRAVYDRYLKSLGWQWVPTMKIGSGCKVHLRDGELPMGRIICRLSHHLCAVIDGVIHDTYNPSGRGTTIYPPSTPIDQLPKGAYWLTNGNGWAYSPDRCVYGYYARATAKD